MQVGGGPVDKTTGPFSCAVLIDTAPQELRLLAYVRILVPEPRKSLLGNDFGFEFLKG
jgi:hypothetical protein